MSASALLGVAVFVFAMMLVGLGLTINEFRNGQPRREDETGDEPRVGPASLRVSSVREAA